VALLFSGSGLHERALIYSAGVILFGALAFLWFRMHGRGVVRSVGERRIYRAGLFLTLSPLLYFLWVGGSAVLDSAQLYTFSRSIEIENYIETPILWDGFDGPVGLRITMDVSYPFQVDGYFRPPKVVTGISTQAVKEGGNEKYWDYCVEVARDGLGCMTSPLWPNPVFDTLDSESATTVTYELYPANLYYMESNNRVCLRKRNPYTQVVRNTGDMAALWHFSNSERIITLDDRLESTILDTDSMLKDEKVVAQWYLNMQSESFLAAGYQSCQINTAIRFSDEAQCFCRYPVSEPDTEK